MARTVGQQSRSCMGWFLAILACLVIAILFHRYIWRPKQAPNRAHLNNLRMSQVSRGYYAFYEQNQRYPESFSELTASEQYKSGIHQDVWGNEFAILEKDGIVYVYSFGPDLTDDHMDILYDPTNGFDSRGDQRLSLRR
jgi:hypothetical protein